LYPLFKPLYEAYLLNKTCEIAFLGDDDREILCQM